MGIVEVWVVVLVVKYEDIKKVYVGILDGKNYVKLENSWEVVVLILFEFGVLVIIVDSILDE